MRSELSSERGFVVEVADIARRTRRHIDEAVKDRGREAVLRVLNDALATQILWVERYRRHYSVAAASRAATAAEEFLKHAIREQDHVYRIAERIVQLGGVPDFRREHSQNVQRQDLLDMIREDLTAERIAHDYYADVSRYLFDSDPASHRLIQDIAALEAEHAMDLKVLMDNLDVSVPEDAA
jgi:bacterioferritin